jgi:hypothetical protein
MKSKEVKRNEAQKRRTEYEALSTEQKIAKATESRGNSQKQMLKLEALPQK